MDLEDRVGLSADVRDELDRALATQRTMEDVVCWVLAARRAITAIVIQDEYTHDVVVPFRDVFLVYDTT